MLATKGPLTLNARLTRLFAVNRHGEATTFAECRQRLGATAATRLLWHGSRFVNFVGLLANGLRVAPKSAPKTGYM